MSDKHHAFLQLVDSKGDPHLLPYGHLLHATMHKQNEIRLFFAAHNVVIAGSALSDIFDQIREMSGTEISPTDEENAPPVGKDSGTETPDCTPHISRITVHEQGR